MLLESSRFPQCLQDRLAKGYWNIPGSIQLGDEIWFAVITTWNAINHDRKSPGMACKSNERLKTG